MGFVGHAALLLQDSNKVWYFTEFTGTIDDKRNAKVYLRLASDQKKESDILNYANNKTIWKSNIFVKNKRNCFYIYGNFNASVKLAKLYSKKYMKYNVIYNNCLTYVKILLQAGIFHNYMTGYYIRHSRAIAPTTFMNNLIYSSTMLNTYTNRRLIMMGVIQ